MVADDWGNDKMFNELTEALQVEDIAANAAIQNDQDIHDAISEQDEVEELATVFDELDNADLFNSDITNDIDDTSDALDIDDDDDDDGDSDDILEESGGVISWIVRQNSVSGYNDLVMQVESELNKATSYAEVMKIQGDIDSYATEMREVIRSDFSRGFKHFTFWLLLLGIPGIIAAGITKYFKETPTAKATVKAALLKMEALSDKAKKKLASVKEAAEFGNSNGKGLDSLNESDLHDLFIIR